MKRILLLFLTGMAIACHEKSPEEIFEKSRAKILESPGVDFDQMILLKV